MIAAINDKHPEIDPSVFVAPSADIMGDVEIAAGSSIWFGTVIRADLNTIRIGARSNIQDNSVLHVDTGRFYMRIGDGVTIGHRVVLHGCTIGDQCLVGMGAVVMNGAKLGAGCIIGAGSLVPQDVEVEPYTVMLGVPARPRRQVTEEDLRMIRSGVDEYCELARRYMHLSVAPQ